MIERLPGWTWEERPGSVVLRLEDQPRAGAIRYVERRRPSGPFETLLEAHLAAGPPGARPAAAPERLVTAEGEYGALVVLRAGAATQIFACVLVDDFHAETVALVADRAQEARFEDAVRRLCRGDRHHMPLRRRPFLYAPPKGWVPVAAARALDLGWRDPRGDGELFVAAATPEDGGADRPPAQAVRPLLPLTTRAGLAATAWEVVIAGSRRRLAAVLHDGRYRYALHLDGRGDGDESERFRAVVASIEPIPEPARAGGAGELPFAGLFG